MPIQGWGHTAYWALSDTIVPPPPPPQPGTYPLWQTTVIAPSLFGALQAWWERLADAVRWWRDLVRRIRRLDDRQRRVFFRVLDGLESPAFPVAQDAVKQTALTLDFARPEAWIPYSRMVKADQGRAENLFRHIRACELTRAALSSTLSNPALNLVVELAYCAYARKGRYF